MRKSAIGIVVVVVLISALLGCDASIAGGSVSPPDWIIGKWDLKVGDTIICTFSFTKDNVVLEVFSDATVMGVDIKEMSKSKEVAINDSNPSAKKYVIEISDISTKEKLTYTFSLNEDGTIDFEQRYAGTVYSFTGFERG